MSTRTGHVYAISNLTLKVRFCLLCGPVRALWRHCVCHGFSTPQGRPGLVLGVLLFEESSCELQHPTIKRLIPTVEHGQRSAHAHNLLFGGCFVQPSTQRDIWVYQPPSRRGAPPLTAQKRSKSDVSKVRPSFNPKTNPKTRTGMTNAHTLQC